MSGVGIPIAGSSAFERVAGVAGVGVAAGGWLGMAPTLSSRRVLATGMSSEGGARLFGGLDQRKASSRAANVFVPRSPWLA
jgi:hypothetical protein